MCCASAPNMCRSTHSVDRSAISNSGCFARRDRRRRRCVRAPSGDRRGHGVGGQAEVALDRRQRLARLAPRRRRWRARRGSGPGKRALTCAWRPSIGREQALHFVLVAITPGPAFAVRMPSSVAVFSSIVTSSWCSAFFGFGVAMLVFFVVFGVARAVATARKTGGDQHQKNMLNE